jgi:pimeloyl-ACP methyl ester carboxylesterase
MPLADLSSSACPTFRLPRTLLCLALTAPSALAWPSAKPGAGADNGPAAKPAVARPEDKTQRVEVTTEDQRVLVGTLLTPKDTKQRLPAALLVPDAGGTRADLAEVATRLVKQGFVVLTIDLRGQGESATKEVDWRQLDEKGQAELWSLAIGDLKAGAEYLRGLDTVQPTSLCLVGYRASCALVTRHAIRDEHVRSLVLIDPQPERLGYSLVKDLEELYDLPTFVAVGKGEEANAKRLKDAAQRQSGGGDFIQVEECKCETGTLLGDKKLAGQLCKWALDRALPKKGDR